MWRRVGFERLGFAAIFVHPLLCDFTYFVLPKFFLKKGVNKFGVFVNKYELCPVISQSKVIDMKKYRYQMSVIAHYPNQTETALEKTNIGSMVGDAACINHGLSLCGFPKITKSLLGRLWVVEPKNEGFANLPVDFQKNEVAKKCWKKETLFLQVQRLEA